MKEEDLEERLDALYRAPLDQFVALRKALADELKKAGKKDVAARVAGLPKPNLVASAVNRYWGDHPKAFAKLLAAGERVREAFGATLASGAGAGGAAALARAQKAQREAIAEALATIERDAAEAGADLTAAAVAKLEPTLMAISTTGRFGEGPPGRLVRELEPPGLEVFADLPAPGASARPRTERAARTEDEQEEPASERRPRRADDARRRARIEGELQAVESELEELAAERDKLDHAERDAKKAEGEAAEALKEARKDRSVARDRVAELERELGEAKGVLSKTEKALERAESEVRSSREERERIDGRRKATRARKGELEARRADLKKELADGR
jgi:hypothetical protein